MRLLIIRHGDPYYPTDSLTEKGFREAELLSRRLVNEHIDKVYVSPLGRAKRTAEPTLSKIGKTAEELEWLREFPVGMAEPFATRLNGHDWCPWNLSPDMWIDQPGMFDAQAWRETDAYRGTGIIAEYDRICGEFDKLLEKHGFTREGHVYRIAEGYENSHETIALFCHMGLGNLLISHLMGLSLIAVWHSLFLPTSSVTTVLMERHLDDRPIAHARLFQIGDTSHLLAGGEPVSDSGLQPGALE